MVILTKHQDHAMALYPSPIQIETQDAIYWYTPQGGPAASFLYSVDMHRCGPE